MPVIVYNSGDLSPCVQEEIYNHNLFKWFTSSSCTPPRTHPSPKHIGDAFFLVSSDKSGEHPASQSESAIWHLANIFSLFQYFFQSQILYQFLFLVYLLVYRSDLVDSLSYDFIKISSIQRTKRKIFLKTLNFEFKQISIQNSLGRNSSFVTPF